MSGETPIPANRPRGCAVSAQHSQADGEANQMPKRWELFTSAGLVLCFVAALTAFLFMPEGWLP